MDFGPLDAVAALLYDGPWVAERHAVVEALLNAQPEAFDPTVHAVISRATQHSATATLRGIYRLRELAAKAQAVWSLCDVPMTPATPGHPRFEEVAADPIGVNSALGRYTNYVNLLD